MSAIVAVVYVTALGGGVLLVAAGLRHVRHFRQLRTALVIQDLLPQRWHRTTATFVVAAEIGVGLGVALIPVLNTAAIPLLMLQAGLYLAFLLYAGVLRAIRPAAPCGCFTGDQPVTVAVVARTGVLALMTAMSVAFIGFRPSWTVPPTVLATAGAIVVAVLAYAVPESFRSPFDPKSTSSPLETSWKP